MVTSFCRLGAACKEEHDGKRGSERSIGRKEDQRGAGGGKISERSRMMNGAQSEAARRYRGRAAQKSTYCRSVDFFKNSCFFHVFDPDKVRIKKQPSYKLSRSLINTSNSKKVGSEVQLSGARLGSRVGEDAADGRTRSYRRGSVPRVSVGGGIRIRL